MYNVIRFQVVCEICPIFRSDTFWRYETERTYDVPVMQLRNFMDRFPWGQNGITYIEHLKVASRV